MATWATEPTIEIGTCLSVDEQPPMNNPTTPPYALVASMWPSLSSVWPSLSSVWPSLFGKQQKRAGVPQPFFAYVGGAASDGWRTARPLSKTPPSCAAPKDGIADPSAPGTGGTAGQDSNGARHTPRILTSVHVLSWNIDFSAPEEVPRMQTALSHMDSIVQQIPESSVVVIFLQEMTEKKLGVMRLAPWVRDRFYMTDDSGDFWMPSNGTTTLVDRRLVICGEGVRRLRLASHFGRDGLFVDLLVRPVDNREHGGGPDKKQDKILRLCNVHLDSLAMNPPRRPAQFAAISPFLQPSATIHASLMAGDTNAIQPFDVTLPAEHNLADAYLSLGGAEGAEDGHTWGYQSGRTGVPPTRLDKILYTGGIEATQLDRLGVGVIVEDVPARTRLANMGKEEYVTDHYGLWGRFEIAGGLGLVSAKEAWR